MNRFHVLDRSNRHRHFVRVRGCHVEPHVQPHAQPHAHTSDDGPPDSSHLTMEIVALPNGTYGVNILDDVASVCRGASSTMTGIAELDEPDTIVIEQPQYACDDGSRARALSGPPLATQLRNLSFTHDSRRVRLRDSLGLLWSRMEVTP